MESTRVDVTVIARHNEDGSVRPLCIIWENGKKYPIDRLLNVCRAASLKGGGVGMRYTCEISGKLAYLWEECGIWFVERRMTPYYVDPELGF